MDWLESCLSEIGRYEHLGAWGLYAGRLTAPIIAVCTRRIWIGEVRNGCKKVGVEGCLMGGR